MRCCRLATATIDGKLLPPPLPQFGGPINESEYIAGGPRLVSGCDEEKIIISF